MSTAAPNTEAIDIHDVPLPTLEQLPNDLDTLKGMIVELMITLRQARRDGDQKAHRIQLLLDRLYGKRTERVNPDQLLLFAEWAAVQEASTAAAVNPAATSAEPDPKTRKRKRTTPHGRGKLPADLPRQP